MRELFPPISSIQQYVSIGLSFSHPSPSGEYTALHFSLPSGFLSKLIELPGMDINAKTARNKISVLLVKMLPQSCGCCCTDPDDFAALLASPSLKLDDLDGEGRDVYQCAKYYGVAEGLFHVFERFDIYLEGEKNPLHLRKVNEDDQGNYIEPARIHYRWSKHTTVVEEIFVGRDIHRNINNNSRVEPTI